MKFYVPHEKAYHVEDQEVKWLEEATLEYQGTRLVRYQWADGWIFEADDSFQTFFAIKTGMTLPYISDQEYRQFRLDKVAYIDKNRAAQMQLAWSRLLSKATSNPNYR